MNIMLYLSDSMPNVLAAYNLVSLRLYHKNKMGFPLQQQITHRGTESAIDIHRQPLTIPLLQKVIDHIKVLHLTMRPHNTSVTGHVNGIHMYRKESVVYSDTIHSFVTVAFLRHEDSYQDYILACPVISRHLMHL